MGAISTMQLVVLMVVFAQAFAQAQKVRYDGHRVYRLQPDSRRQVDALRAIQERSFDTGISFWTEEYGISGIVDVMVPPEGISNFEQTMNALGLQYELHIQDVQRLVDMEQPLQQSSAGSFNWDRYHSVDEIYAWLRSLAAQNPGIVSLVDVGPSAEGRPILGVKVSRKSGNQAVFIEGGIHASEWVAPAVVTYLLNQLVASADPEVRNISENFDWHVFPIINPDGYEYSQAKDRMWHKSRRFVGSYKGQQCYGVDLNRNWNFHWIGSENACSKSYPGPSAFSEPESAELSDYLGNSSHIAIYVAFHSPGQKIYYPYGVSGIRPSNEAELKSVASAAAASLAKRYGTKYDVGMFIDNEPNAPGSSLDWVSSFENVHFAFAYELRDNGTYGVLLPAEQIIPSGQETLDSLVSLVSEASKYL